MSLDKLKRREFLKVLGWSGVGTTLAGCDMPTTVTVQEGKEEVVAYLAPEEYVIPGIGVWYASTCAQCGSGCGVHGRVREGRVLKLEGNPDSQVNRGRLCQAGQASLQAHYNPDRITAPRVRRNGQFEQISWDQALALLEEKVGPSSGLSGDRFAWVTDSVSGHQSVLLKAWMDAVGSGHHYVHEAVNDAVWRAVCRDMLGDANPRLRLDKARVILSFGADFLSTWGSTIHNSTQYAEFRTAPRGVLIQAEPKMTVTGASADLWIPVRPGAEGVLALAIAHVLVSKHHRDISNLPVEAQEQIRAYDIDKAVRLTGATGEHIVRIAGLLNDRAPSLVLAGASAAGHARGYDSVAAAMLLNIVLGNVGKTLESSAGFPFPQLAAKTGGNKELLDFAAALESKSFDVVFFKGANPVYTAPDALKLKEKLAGVPFKVAFTQFDDETTQQADLVLPLRSALEDWGTHVPAAQPAQMLISMQQPLMEPLYPETRGFGDTLLALLKLRKVSQYAAYDDYYAYLRNAFAALPAALKQGTISDQQFWTRAVQKGVIEVGAGGGSLTSRVVAFAVAEPADQSRSYTLVPSAGANMQDGRYANLPWLQELPDPISKVVWDSWAELHPSTAAKIGVKTGDRVRIESEHGAIEAKVYVYKGMHPNAIAVPLGQGHEAYGRYAQGRGVNPLRILGLATEVKTGELAHHATPVQVTRIADKAGDKLVKLGGSEAQLGRKLVATVTADVYARNEGEA
ncbi:MAG: molybdopterin-dependent oxidoreductase [Gammaproteobacteria bacterium]|nr:molybdopterin-dependent oxidoreductase [Gammaproteobacteria bacterium]